MKLTAPLICAAALSAVLTGTALAQSHDHNAKNAEDAKGTHGSMSPTASGGDAMRKMDHGAGSHTDRASGHAHRGGTMADGEVPADLDTVATKLSERRHYRVSIAPRAEPVAINALQSWVLEITTPNGKPVETAEVSVDGGMPAHGHGLPTAPRVTKYLGDGKYLVEGVRFNMAGWWQMTFAIEGHHRDTASFNIIAE